MNGLVNGDNNAVQLINHQGAVQQNLVPVCKFSKSIYSSLLYIWTGGL